MSTASGLKQVLLSKWLELSSRERYIVAIGGVVAVLIFSYQLVFAPVLNASNVMQANIGSLRTNLVWLREQANSLPSAESGQSQSGTGQNNFEASDQSLVSILERTARSFQLDGSIQQLTPGDNPENVSVVMEDASFNAWVRWVSVLEQQYGVKVLNATVERQQAPDMAEVRMEFVRN